LVGIVAVADVITNHLQRSESSEYDLSRNSAW
jgi:hypothetical protein